MKEYDIVILTNSPGELYAWVRPTVAAISKKIPTARVIIVITPCQYSSGRELEVARQLQGVDEVILPQEYNKWISRNIAPKGITFSPKGVVLYMGGDLFHGVLLSKKLDYPALAYSQERSLWKKFYKKYLVPYPSTADEFCRRGVAKEKIVIVGNLTVDSVSLSFEKDEAAKRWNLDPNLPIVAFMPGSRPFQIKYMTPFFLKVADLLKEKLPQSQFLLSLSPYVNTLMIEDSLKNWREKREGLSPEICSDGNLITDETKNETSVRTSSGTILKIIEGSHFEAVNAADLTITLPGTNTAEIAALGKPMVVALLLNIPEVIPLEGLLDILGNIPHLGKLVRKTAVWVLDKTTKYVALPNMYAGKMITPELRGILNGQEVADKAFEVLSDKDLQSRISQDLKEVIGEPGAAERIAEEVEKQLNPGLLCRETRAGNHPIT